MAISLKHTTQATGTDAGNGEIRKAQWNQEHTLTCATGVVLGRATAGTGAVEEITNLSGTSVFAKSRAYLATAQNSVANTWHKVVVDTTSFDVGTIWNSTNKRFVPTKAGYYMCNLKVGMSAAGRIILSIGFNGANTANLGSDTNTTSSFATGGTGLIYCNGTTDYLELWSFTDSARAYLNNSGETYMEVLGPF